MLLMLTKLLTKIKMLPNENNNHKYSNIVRLLNKQHEEDWIEQTADVCKIVAVGWDKKIDLVLFL